ncbi:N-acetyltransferase [candidate division KSB1 bacterium]|nr:MAG: N-acetyltransferase [candidate division KSB1 bacterium]
MIEIIQVETPAPLAQIRALFLEYAESLGFSLCFQSFDEELAGLPGMYAMPEGRLLIAYLDGEPVGCAALHKLEDGICEMKRLYVKPAARGHGIGKLLSQKIIAEAKAIGYTSMRLDTIADRMQTAVDIYRTQGFVEIPPYRENPIASALYMELDLTRKS